MLSLLIVMRHCRRLQEITDLLPILAAGDIPNTVVQDIR
jgi:hypothetical protein